jgi:hypothetical protein
MPADGGIWQVALTPLAALAARAGHSLTYLITEGSQ